MSINRKINQHFFFLQINLIFFGSKYRSFWKVCWSDDGSPLLHSLLRISTGVSTPVSFVSTVGVDVGANVWTTDMEDEPPLS